MNRIGEVKKICPRCKGTGRIIWHDRQSGSEFKGMDIERPCPDCQLFPQPLDDKELRDKIANVSFSFGFTGRGMTQKTIREVLPLLAIDQILALLQPKIEEARAQGKKRAVEFIESYLVTTVHPEGNMHHIDDKEWQSVKLRLLRQALSGKGEK